MSSRVGAARQIVRAGFSISPRQTTVRNTRRSRDEVLAGSYLVVLEIQPRSLTCPQAPSHPRRSPATADEPFYHRLIVHSFCHTQSLHTSVTVPSCHAIMPRYPSPLPSQRPSPLPSQRHHRASRHTSVAQPRHRATSPLLIVSDKEI